MKKLLILLVLSVLLPGAEVYAQTVINFDNLADNVQVTNQYPSATFSSSAGNTNWTSAQAASFGSSVPNFICTGPVTGGITCTDPTFVDFTTPVSNLTFVGTGISNTGTVAQVNVFVNGNLSSTVDVIGQGNQSVPVNVDLSSFVNVTRIEIVNITDPGGIGWDDFTFTPGNVAPPPSPTNVPTLNEWGMIIFMVFAALGSVYYLRRKRRA